MTRDEQVYRDLALRYGAGEFGAVSAEDGVRAAADPAHPWHHRLTWDDAVAGHQYRLEQMRLIYRGIRIELHEEPVRRTRATVHLGSQRGYVPVDTMLAHPALRTERLERARHELAACRRRYAHLEELAAVWAAVDALNEPALSA